MLRRWRNLGRGFGASGMRLGPLVAWAAVRSGVVVLLLLTFVCCCSLCGGLWLFYVLLYVSLCPFWYCTHLGGEGGGGLVALLNLSSWCLVVVGWLFLVVPWGCLWFVIVVFPDHTHSLFFITFVECLTACCRII